jgi:hypothetical protein
MATRSRIAIENQDGTVLSIYCHWDGYPSHHGPILLEHYTTQEKVESLIELGSISSLAPETEIPGGVTHNFENPADGIVVAYHRDRKEPIAIKAHGSVNDFVKSDIEEYGYIFTAAGEWLFANGHVGAYDREAVTLESVVVKEEDAE